MPGLKSLKSHTVPHWFSDAKFGVIVHWGLFSVPGFAPAGRLTDIIRTNYSSAMVNSPYSVDYWNSVKDPSSPAGMYHAGKYQGRPYEDFKPVFEAGLRNWDPDSWANTFKQAGARYVILSAKNSDGYCLWPTSISNPRMPGWCCSRDIVGELAAAVRHLGLKFGVYYSGGIDGTFCNRIIRTLGDYGAIINSKVYTNYAEAQVRELIGRYKPDILWNDVSWPAGQKALLELFSFYYNLVPEGAVNDRWITPSLSRRLAATSLGRRFIDSLTRSAVSRIPGFLDSSNPPPVSHCDFTTLDYKEYSSIQIQKWETVRATGSSFGFNRTETEAEYASFEHTLFPVFIDAVSKNGNLLLSIGPAADGSIPEPQLARLNKFGNWLALNGEAVYGTRPWTKAEASTETADNIRLTAGPDAIYLIYAGLLNRLRIVIKDFIFSGRFQLVGSEIAFDSCTESGNTVLVLPRAINVFSPVFKLSGNTPGSF